MSQTRDRHLADRLLSQVRACVLAVRTVLVATDGWAAYPKSIKRAFREKVKETAGKGRACLRVWTDVCIVTVIKCTEKKHVIEVTRISGVLPQTRNPMEYPIAPDLAVIKGLAFRHVRS